MKKVGSLTYLLLNSYTYEPQMASRLENRGPIYFTKWRMKWPNINQPLIKMYFEADEKVGTEGLLKKELEFPHLYDSFYGVEPTPFLVVLFLLHRVQTPTCYLQTLYKLCTNEIMLQVDENLCSRLPSLFTLKKSGRQQPSKQAGR